MSTETSTPDAALVDKVSWTLLAHDLDGDTGSGAKPSNYHRLTAEAVLRALDLSARDARIRAEAVAGYEQYSTALAEERDGLRTELEFARVEAKSIYDTCKQIEHERDEWRQACESARSAFSTLMAEHIVLRRTAEAIADRLAGRKADATPAESPVERSTVFGANAHPLPWSGLCCTVCGRRVAQNPVSGELAHLVYAIDETPEHVPVLSAEEANRG